MLLRPNTVFFVFMRAFASSCLSVLHKSTKRLWKIDVTAMLDTLVVRLLFFCNGCCAHNSPG